MSRSPSIVSLVSFVLVVLSLGLVVAALAVVASPRRAHADDCRDSTGEPVPCAPSYSAPAPAYAPPVSSPAPAYVPPGASPAPAPAPSPVASDAPRRPEPGGLVTFDLSGESLDLRPLSLTPFEPEDVADLARDTRIFGAGSPYDVPAMTFGLSLAPRPVPWLEIPTLRLAWGFGTPEATVPVPDQAGRLADLGTLFYVRLEIGAGFDAPIGDVVSIFARGHVALAGYFVSARVLDETLGSLGRTWLAEDAWEVGWTAGLAVRLEGPMRWVLSYRHVHTGVESNVISMGVSVDLR